MGRTYTNTERARMGGYARAKKLGKRCLSEQARKASIIRWARVKGFLPPALCKQAIGMSEPPSGRVPRIESEPQTWRAPGGLSEP